VAYRIADPKAGQEGQKDKLVEARSISTAPIRRFHSPTPPRKLPPPGFVKRGVDPNANKRQVLSDSGGTLSVAALAEKWHAEMLATTKKKPKAESTLNRIKDHKDSLIANLGKFVARPLSPLRPVAAATPKCWANSGPWKSRPARKVVGLGTLAARK
jgi:hypothetical protein